MIGKGGLGPLFSLTHFHIFFVMIPRTASPKRFPVHGAGDMTKTSPTHTDDLPARLAGGGKGTVGGGGDAAREIRDVVASPGLVEQRGKLADQLLVDVRLSHAFAPYSLSRRSSPQPTHGGVKGVKVAVAAKAADHADGHLADIGVMPVGFALMDVGQVNLDERPVDTGESVAEGDRSVGIGARIDQKKRSVIIGCLMNSFNQVCFSVTLQSS